MFAIDRRTCVRRSAETEPGQGEGKRENERAGDHSQKDSLDGVATPLFTVTLGPSVQSEQGMISRRCRIRGDETLRFSGATASAEMAAVASANSTVKRNPTRLFPSGRGWFLLR